MLAILVISLLLSLIIFFTIMATNYYDVQLDLLTLKSRELELLEKLNYTMEMLELNEKSRNEDFGQTFTLD